MHFHYRMTFTGYIRCFCATLSHDLVTLTFDLLTLGLLRVQRFSCLTHIPIFIILWLSVTELRVLNIGSHFPFLKQSLRTRRVTWPLTGGKNSPHFWNPWPQFAYSLCHLHGATTKIKPCCRQKIAFSHYEGHKVYCACAVSRDLCIGGRPKPHVTIFILEHPHVKAVFGRKKTKSSQKRSVQATDCFCCWIQTLPVMWRMQNGWSTMCSAVLAAHRSAILSPLCCRVGYSKSGNFRRKFQTCKTESLNHSARRLMLHFGPKIWLPFTRKHFKLHIFEFTTASI